MAEESLVSPPPAALSQGERVLNTFVAPSATFRDILRSTAWWLPFCLLALASVGVAYTMDRQVGYAQIAETQIHLSPSQENRLSTLTPQVRAAQMQRIAASYRIFSYASPVFVLLLAALATLVLWVSFNFGLGARTTYGQVFCLWMYASLPRLLTAIITIISLCFGSSPESFNLKEPAGTNLAYYLPDAAPWLRALLGFFDGIGIWCLVLLILGGAIVARVKVAHAAIVVVGWWLLILIVSVAATAAFS